MMELGVVVMVVMLQTRNDNWHRTFNIDRLRDVARHWNVFALNNRHMPNLLDKNRNLFFNRNLLHFSVIPVVDIIARVDVRVHLIDLLHSFALFRHEGFRRNLAEQHRNQDNRLELGAAIKQENDLWISAIKNKFGVGDNKKKEENNLTIFSIFRYFSSCSSRWALCCSVWFCSWKLSDKFIWFPIDIYTLLSCLDKTHSVEQHEKFMSASFNISIRQRECRINRRKLSNAMR